MTFPSTSLSFAGLYPFGSSIISQSFVASWRRSTIRIRPIPVQIPLNLYTLIPLKSLLFRADLIPSKEFFGALHLPSHHFDLSVAKGSGNDEFLDF